MEVKTKDSNKEMLDWQLRTILAQLDQVQIHASDPTCPCRLRDIGEFCLPKHLNLLASLSWETAAMDSKNDGLLYDLGNEATDMHKKTKDHVCGKGENEDVVTWARSWRKKIEPIYYACAVKQSKLKDAAPEIAALMAPKAHKHTLLSARGISDFRIGVDKYIRRGKKCFVIDTEGIFGDTEVECDFITPEIEANIAKLTPEQRQFMIAAVRSSPFVTDEGKRERLELLAKGHATFEIIETADMADPASMAPSAPVKVSGHCDANKCTFRVAATETTAGKTDTLRGLGPLIKEISTRAAEHRPVKVIQGKATIAPTTNKTFAMGITTATRYEFEWQIVEGDKLIVSNDPFSFEPNPKYIKALQPRERGRAATKLQVETIASKLAPDLLILDFLSLDKGSPIIGPDNIVECGNGRVMGIVRAARDHKEKFTAYRSRLKEKAVEYGLDPGDVDKMKVPILVRLRLTPVDRQAFAEECNARTGIQTSAIENAKSDAAKITTEMLGGLDVLEGESIENAIRATRNKPFVVAFLNKLPANEQAGLVDSKGVLSQDGVRRIVTAIFLATFRGEVGMTLGEKFFEATEADVKNVFAGILRALAPLARAETLASTGQREPGYSFGEDLAKIIGVYSRIKQMPNYTVAKYIAQLPLESRELNLFQEDVLKVLDNNSRSAKRIGQILTNYGQAVIDSAPPGQATFMAMSRPSKADLWQSAVKRAQTAFVEDIVRFFDHPVAMLEAPRRQLSIGTGRASSSI
jgi:hypothetical protein